MSSKAKRPALLDLNSLMVKSPSSAPAETAPPAPPVAAPGPAKPAAAAPDTFRTSVYFARAVHDKLREIAFEERKSVTDLINEGLDHVLTTRNYATTAELRAKKS